MCGHEGSCRERRPGREGLRTPGEASSGLGPEATLRMRSEASAYAVVIPLLLSAAVRC